MTTTPIWVALIASALGGAGLTGLVTVATRILDGRHRHDDVRRDRYVDFLVAIEALQQALVDAIDTHNARTFEDIPPESMTTAQAEAIKRAQDCAGEAARETSPKFNDARRAHLTITLFAPDKVLGPAHDLMDAMADQYIPFQQMTASPSVPGPMPEPVWPQAAYVAFAAAVRRDLGVDGVGDWVATRWHRLRGREDDQDRQE